MKAEESLVGLAAADRRLRQERAKRLQAKEGLIAGAEKYRELVQYANSIIFCMDTKGCVTFFNEYAQSFFGYREEEILGQNIVGTIVPERETTGRDLAAMFKDLVMHPERYANNENENMRRSGERVWVAWTNQAILDDQGQVSEILCIGNDITQRVRAEEALTEERNVLRTLIDNVPDFIFVKDRESRFLINNRPHLSVLGATSQDEVYGKTDLDIFPSDLAAQYYADEQELIESGQSLLDREEPYIDPEGVTRWLSTTKVPLRDSQGEVVGLVGISRDITERKLADAEGEGMLADLERRTSYLHVATEVTRAATSILDPDELIQQVVDLVQERFNLYYAGLFLVDQTGQWTSEPGKWAVLRAGTGEAGRQMLEAGHKLAIGGTSMIGWCVANSQARIALDVGEEAVRFENPWLPHTRSEMALPLISRGRVIGAMTIQSIQGEAFSDEDIAVLQTLADQLAVAIENARLFDQEKRASLLLTERVKELDCLNDISRKMEETPPVPEFLEWVTGCIRLAVRHMEACITAIEFDGHIYGLAEAFELPHQIVQNLRIGGELVGWVCIAYREDHDFLDEDSRLLGEIARRVSGYIENRRLLAETQKALREAQLAHQQYLRQEWRSFLAAQKDRHQLGYVLTRDGLQPLSQGSLPETPLALHSQGPNTVRDSQEKPFPGQNGDGYGFEVGTEACSALAAPISLRGQVIGTLDVFDPDQPREWTEDELALVDAVTSQVALAVENARLFEQTQSALAETEALYRASHRITTSSGLPTLYQILVDEMASRLGADQCQLTVFDQVRDLAEIMAEYRSTPDEKKLPISMAESHSYEILRDTQRPLAIEDVSAHPALTHLKPVLAKRKVQSTLLVPILVRGQLVGSLQLEYTGRKRIFTEAELDFCQALAGQAAITIENMRAFIEIQRRVDELGLLFNVSRSLAGAPLESEEIATIVSRQFVAMTDVPECSISLLDPSDGTMRVLVDYFRDKNDILQEEVRETFSLSDFPATARAMETLQPFVVHASDLEADPAELAYMRKYDVTTLAVVPMAVKGQAVGVIELESWGQERHYTSEELNLAITLANQAAVALENARLYEEQRHTAERLTEVDKLKTQFLANMSHELRTPLNSIIGFSRVVLKGIDGPLTELQKTDLTAIYNSGQHLLGLINDILDLSKIEAGKMELNFDEVDLKPIIKGVMSSAVGLVKEKPIKLEQNVPEELPIIWADSTRLRQVLLNLVSNATKFTEEGSITLSVDHNDDWITIAVTDTGIGIPEEKLETIFEEFTQVDGSTTRSVGGTGLGLPITRHFVELHHGQISVVSSVGEGSTFIVKLPAHARTESDEKPAEDQAKNGAAIPQRRVVLAVDDDPGVISLYRRYLDGKGYQVVGISNSSEVLNRAIELQPFAITLDILMPTKDGWQVLRELKECLQTAHIPIIICSIVSDEGQGFSLGAADYLVKPIMEEELLTALSRLDQREKEEKETKVLVIDDQADDILLIRRILEAQSHFRVLEASGGQAGIDRVRQYQPDVIILDLMMPELDGFAVLEALKREPDTRDIPVIVITAKALNDEERQQLDGRVEALLRKGLFSEHELLEDLGNALCRIETG